MNCVDCGRQKAKLGDELCEECLEKQTGSNSTDEYILNTINVSFDRGIQAVKKGLRSTIEVVLEKDPNISLKDAYELIKKHEIL